MANGVTARLIVAEWREPNLKTTAEGNFTALQAEFEGFQSALGIPCHRAAKRQHRADVFAARW